MPATIRPRREEDMPALATVLVRVHAVDGYPVEGVTHPEEWLRHHRELASWTAEVDEAPVGQVMLTAASAEDDAARVWQEHTGGDVAQLAIPARLFVDPDHRGAGIGRDLMAAALDEARSLGRAVAFDVMKKDRAAISLYERMGADRLRSIEHQLGVGRVEPAAVYALTTPGDVPAKLRGEGMRRPEAS